MNLTEMNRQLALQMAEQKKNTQKQEEQQPQQEPQEEAGQEQSVQESELDFTPREAEEAMKMLGECLIATQKNATASFRFLKQAEQTMQTLSNKVVQLEVQITQQQKEQGVKIKVLQRITGILALLIILLIYLLSK